MKKLVCLLLTLALCLGLLPLSAAALRGGGLTCLVVGEQEFRYNDGTSVTVGARDLPGLDETVYEKADDPAHSTWWITCSSPQGAGDRQYVLTLSGAAITGTSEVPRFGSCNLFADGDLAIQLAEGTVNTIGDPNARTALGMCCKHRLVIYGAGRITVNGGIYALCDRGLLANDPDDPYDPTLAVTVRDGADVAFSAKGENAIAVCSRSLSVDNAAVTATASGEFIAQGLSLYDGGLVLVNDATVTAQTSGSRDNVGLDLLGLLFLCADEERISLWEGDSPAAFNGAPLETGASLTFSGQYSFNTKPCVRLQTKADPYALYVGGVKVSPANANDVLGVADGEDATVKFIPATEEKPATLSLSLPNEITMGSQGPQFVGSVVHPDTLAANDPLKDVREDLRPAPAPRTTRMLTGSCYGFIHSLLTTPLVVQFTGDSNHVLCQQTNGEQMVGVYSRAAPVTFRGTTAESCLSFLDYPVGVYAPAVTLARGKLGVTTIGGDVKAGIITETDLTMTGGTLWVQANRLYGAAVGRDMTVTGGNVWVTSVSEDDDSHLCALGVGGTLKLSGANTRLTAACGKRDDLNDFLGDAYGRMFPEARLGSDTGELARLRISGTAIMAGKISLANMKIEKPQNGKVGSTTFFAILDEDREQPAKVFDTIVGTDGEPADAVLILPGSPMYYYEESCPITVSQPKHAALAASAREAALGANVTITVDADEGWHASSVTVRDASGALVETTLTGNTASFRMPSSAVTVSALIRADELPFGDVSEKDWFYQAVKYCYEIGALSGMTETAFAPDRLMSRAMFAAVLYNLAGSPPVTGENPFPDVPDGKWYTEAVIWASQNGVIYGYEDGTFGPKNPVTREQMITQFWRTLGEPEATADLSVFSDADQIHSWARPAMEWAVSQGILVGKSGRLDPQGKATRAEAAQIVMQVETMA